MREGPRRDDGRNGRSGRSRPRNAAPLHPESPLTVRAPKGAELTGGRSPRPPLRTIEHTPRVLRCRLTQNERVGRDAARHCLCADSNEPSDGHLRFVGKVLPLRFGVGLGPIRCVFYRHVRCVALGGLMIRVFYVGLC